MWMRVNRPEDAVHSQGIHVLAASCVHVGIEVCLFPDGICVCGHERVCSLNIFFMVTLSFRVAMVHMWMGVVREHYLLIGSLLLPRGFLRPNSGRQVWTRALTR